MSGACRQASVAARTVAAIAPTTVATIPDASSSLPKFSASSKNVTRVSDFCPYGGHAGADQEPGGSLAQRLCEIVPEIIRIFYADRQANQVLRGAVFGIDGVSGASFDQ